MLKCEVVVACKGPSQLWAGEGPRVVINLLQHFRSHESSPPFIHNRYSSPFSGPIKEINSSIITGRFTCKSEVVV